MVFNIDGSRGTSLNAGMTTLRSIVPGDVLRSGRSLATFGDFADRYFRSDGLVMIGDGDSSTRQP